MATMVFSYALTNTASTKTTKNTSVNVKNARKVLVIYTGGTIGMVKNREGALAPEKGVFEKLVRSYPQLHDDSFWNESVKKDPLFDKSFLVLPETKDLPNDMRIFYQMMEYDPLLDSSDMTEKDWRKIAEDIMAHYKDYDGFVVLHGTDTLAYTASALSFMFENIGKCIVLTGAQIPMFEPRSDGADNFVSSLLIAGSLNIPEVTIFFASKLLRGNRTKKMSTDNLYAFDSPNHVPLVNVGINFEVNKKAIFKPTVIAKCHLHSSLSKNVGLLRVFPNVSGELFKAFCQPPIKGIVLESYGSGNIPSEQNRPDVYEEIKAAVKRGVIFVNITQCNTGSVSPIYEAGLLLEKYGVVSGYDMTPEAALTKLSYVVSKTELSYAQKIDMMSRNIRGELTDLSSVPQKEDHTLLNALTKSLNIQCPRKQTEVCEKVYTALLLHAIQNKDMPAIKKMIEMGADLNAQNSDGKTALHEAILHGDMCVVEYLLKHGANVHVKTRSGEPPLLTAIQRDDEQMTGLICKCGGHLSCLDRKTQAELVSNAARIGNIKKLQLLHQAGADLNSVDELGQTPLHKAVLCNYPDAVKFLVKKGVKQDVPDILNCTPMDYAIKLALEELQQALRNNNRP